jgi:cysteine desulfurase
MKEIYLDNSATTKVDSKVVKVVKEVFTKNYGNPSSLHSLGEKSRKAIDKSRKNLSREIGAKPQEIIFTSGGTESNNLAIQGLAKANSKKKKIIISSIEHPSITETCKFMKSEGYEIVEIPVNREGILNIEKLENSIDKNTLLVSVIHVNNVFGTIQNLKNIGKICKMKKVYFHTDAIQSFGKLKINIKDMNIDLLSASGHKIGGPKGTGFLYLKEGVKIKPLIFGGGQEKNIRSGTENVSGIVGFSKALDLEKTKNSLKISKLQKNLIDELEKLGGKINGSKEKRICNNVHVSFKEINSERLIYFLSERKIYASIGSACDRKKRNEDNLLKNIGMNKKEINGSIRFTLNKGTTEKDIRKVIEGVRRFLKFSK